MVHGHPRLLDRFDLMGIHFTEKERTHNLQRLRQLRLAQPGCRLSSAFHRIMDIPEHDGLFDYILLSPIFDSISKPGYRAAFDHSELRRFLSRTKHTVIALGGLDAQRAATAASLGFKGIAVLGAVWQALPPEKAARQLSAAVQHSTMDAGCSVFMGFSPAVRRPRRGRGAHGRRNGGCG